MSFLKKDKEKDKQIETVVKSKTSSRKGEHFNCFIFKQQYTTQFIFLYFQIILIIQTL